jgi:hypothetical protein
VPGAGRSGVPEVNGGGLEAGISGGGRDAEIKGGAGRDVPGTAGSSGIPGIRGGAFELDTGVDEEEEVEAPPVLVLP